MNTKQVLDTQKINELKKLLKEKKYPNLVDRCNFYIKGFSQPNDPIVYLLKGIALRELNSYDESNNVYLEALKIFPDNDDLLNDLSRLLIIRKEFTKAEAILKKLVSKNKNNQVAKQNLESLKILLDKIDKTEKIKLQKHEASRSLSPLKSAFNPSEVKESRENLKKVSKLKLERKLNNLPELPIIDKEVLAEEWISAGKDALRSKYPALTLKFCGYAVANKGNTCQIYGLAADAYLSIKQYMHAHLCYLIAAEHGELDSQQQVNLLSLAAMIGDNTILTSRNNKIAVRVNENSNSHKSVEKIMTSLGENSSTVFDSKRGIISIKELRKAQLSKDNK